MEKRYRPGARLEPTELTTTLLASTTPVREALNQLVGEGLVETRSGGGFHVPLLDEPSLKDLYALSGEIIQLALKVTRLSILASIEIDRRENVAAAATSLFQGISEASINKEHGVTMSRINARLFPLRLGEPYIWGDLEAELGSLGEFARAGDVPQLRRASSAYHRRRIAVASRLLHHLYRDE